MLSFERSFDGHVDVSRLAGAELGQLGAQPTEMKSGDLFIELLGQHVDSDLVVVPPEGDLGKGLVGEACST